MTVRGRWARIARLGARPDPRWLGLLVAMVCGSVPDATWRRPCAADEAPAAEARAAEVRLVTGRALRGRIAQERAVNGTRMLEVVTDFGTVLVPAEQVQATVPGTPPSTGTFVAEGVRVVRIQGQVERRAPGENHWSPVRWTDAYGKEIVNAPNAIVRVGDRVRTFLGGEVDLQLHKDVWLRLAEDSELEIPAAPTSASTLTLTRGRLLPQVEGRPRGATFRIATPSVLLGVRGTRFAVEVGDGGAAVLVAEGAVAVGAGPEVAAGQRADLRGASAPIVRALTPAEVDGLRVNGVRIPPESLVWIPGGRYTLGDGKDATPDNVIPGGFFGREACPAPDASNIDVLATVTLPGFLIDRRECSVAEFAAFAAMRGVAMPEAMRSHDPTPVPDRWPVWGVEWRAARSYACWVGRRLPSEAQWEVAARGGDRRLWPWGNRLTSEHEALPAWRDCTGDESHRDAGVPRLYLRPKPCRSLRPVDAPTPDVSPFGVEALVSGVPEWTRDTWVARNEGRFSGHVGEAELPSFEKDPAVRKVVRGAFLSARWAMEIPVYRSFPTDNPGLRCVVDSE